jgi:hypothetical protein
VAVLRRVFPASLYLAALAVFFWGALRVKVDILLEHLPRHGDVLQHIPPFWRYYFAHRGLAAGSDFISEYYLQVILPPLYKATFWVVSFFMEPTQASVYLVLVIWGVVVVALSLAAYQLSRSSVFTFCVSALTLSSVIFGNLWNTPLERTFGAALLAVATYFLAIGRVNYLGYLAVVAVMFYPPVALIILGVFLLKSFIDWILGERSLRSLALPLVIIFLFGLAASPQLLAGQSYGARLTIADVTQYPEVGPGGRLSAVDMGQSSLSLSSVIRGNLNRYLLKVSKETKTPGLKRKLTSLIVLITGLAVVVLVITKLRKGALSKPAEAQVLLRLGLIPLSMILCSIFAYLLFPLLYIPSRYISTGAAPVVLVLLPALIWVSIGQLVSDKIRGFIALISTACLLLILHGGFPSSTGVQKKTG